MLANFSYMNSALPKSYYEILDAVLLIGLVLPIDYATKHLAINGVSYICGTQTYEREKQINCVET